MNWKKLIKSLMRMTLVLAALVLTSGPSLAATYNLAAVEAQWLPPGGTAGFDEIPMWGFITDTGACPTGPVEWQPGPALQPTDDVLTINLRNCLAEPVSIVIPGQSATGMPVWVGGRVRSFTNEAAVDGTASYTWTGLKEGTYLYESGTHPAKQVQMGLYGALVVLPAAGQAYTPTADNPGTAFDAEVVVLYSEIDPNFHDPPGVPKPLDYVPHYYLINGKPYETGDAPLTAGNVNQNVLIRFLNAGLKTHVPTLFNAPYLSVIAEDGNLYPYAKSQYSVLLAAGKTMDAIWSPTAEGSFALIDRSNHLTTAGATGGGMLTYLQVATTSGAPVAVDDAVTVEEDSGAASHASVLANDTGTGLSAVLVNSTSNGALALATDGTFSYTPNSDFNGIDTFSYKVFDGTNYSNNVAMVSITVNSVNDAPVAVGDAYDVLAGETLTVALPGVLGNDSDVDGDTLTAVVNANASGGSLTLNSDGSFSYTPDQGTTSDSFTYYANDGMVDSNTVTVNITVTAPANTAPVAVDDYATTAKNVPVFINLVANDTDADGNLKDASGNVAAARIIIVTQPTRGGTVSVLTDGVNFTPKKNFRGTDVFTYTVRDLAGAVSNTATVRVNVTNN